MERFREGAERYGWIVVSSNNAKSDDPTAPNMQAMSAMWEDSIAAFPSMKSGLMQQASPAGRVWPAIWATGFPAQVAGVIGCGAGFPQYHLPTADTPFAYFGTIGVRDYNFYEMRGTVREVEGTGSALPYSFL